jgi:hypothetical protein
VPNRDFHQPVLHDIPCERLRTAAGASGNPSVGFFGPALWLDPVRYLVPSTQFEDVNNCLIDQFQPAEQK